METTMCKKYIKNELETLQNKCNNTESIVLRYPITDVKKYKCSKIFKNAITAHMGDTKQAVFFKVL